MMNRFPGGARTPEEQRRRQRSGILRSVALLAGLIVLTVWIALQRQQPEVLSLTTARALDSDYQPVEPTTSYGPDDTFFISVELRGYRTGMNITALWRHQGEVIAETPLLAEAGEAGIAGFSLSPESPPRWPEGGYVVDIMYDGHVVGRTAFDVVEEQP